MTGSIRSVCIGVAAATLAIGLGACTQTTYGTGTPVGMQTIQDLAGIADLASPKQDNIQFAPRPGLVPPPPGAPLPPPDSDKQAVAANWPKDPDAEAKRFRADVAAREKFCADQANKIRPECRDPGFRLPESTDSGRQPNQTLVNAGMTDTERGDQAHSTATQNEAAKKLFARANGQVAVDENGKPIRRYLTDPPSDYRMPDPNAPVVFDKKAAQKKFRWPWEKASPATDSVTPDTTSTASGTASANGGT